MLIKQTPYVGLSASVGNSGTKKLEKVKAIQNLIKLPGVHWPQGGLSLLIAGVTPILPKQYAGIEEYKAVICSRSDHINGSEAGNFVKFYRPLVDEIIPQQ